MLTNGYNTTHMTNSVLEQFNEEVMKEIPHHVICGHCNVKPTMQDFITKKLAEHKELILKMVREKVPKIKITGEGTYCQTCRQHKAAGECDCIGFNKGVQEFLNNLDTI